jgi:hypothetical protein
MNVVMPTTGILIEEFNPFIFQMLKKEALEGVETINENLTTRNGDLLNMFQQDLPKKVYFKEIDKCKEAVYQEVLKKCKKLGEENPEYLDTLYYYTKGYEPGTPMPELTVERTWINYQHSGEYVPLHQHSGLFSFVVWIKIPTEVKVGQYGLSSADGEVRHGQFEFVYTDVLGKIKTMQLAHDSSWEGKIAVFPAAMHHQVYPHHSNDVRISISGNIRAKI